MNFFKEKVFQKYYSCLRKNFLTRRVISYSLEKILYRKFPVLDHGFIRIVDYMGNDTSVVQAARVSYGSGTKHVSKDKNLIHYLMRHNHTTPFEMCEIKLHIKAPIFVARQWIRHRTANVNEYSGRYSILSSDFYLPKVSQISSQSNLNKQGRSRNILFKDSLQVLNILKKYSDHNYSNYLHMLSDIDAGGLGLSRELSRLNLNLNYYTEFYWKIDLHNLLNFIRLRFSKRSQYEFAVYAEVVFNILSHWCPLVCQSFKDCILNGINLSEHEILLMKRIVLGEEVIQSGSGLSFKEWKDLIDKFSHNSI
jgi:thymidylate synthase (FAD)